jgi:menaquinone-dependent protoporphyrinogen oxidase
MQPILVAYATTEGQTRKIAEFIAERLRVRGHRVDLVDTATPAAEAVTPVYQGAILGGSVHQQRHPASLLHFIKRNHAWLSALPSAIFSVSLAAALDDIDSRIEVQRSLNELIDDCALKPVVSCCVAGALKYTQYDYFKRLVMRMIARQRGQSTDTSTDHEYTDWGDVEAFVDEFLATAGIPVPTQAAQSVASEWLRL